MREALIGASVVAVSVIDFTDEGCEAGNVPGPSHPLPGKEARPSEHTRFERNDRARGMPIDPASPPYPP